MSHLGSELIERSSTPRDEPDALDGDRPNNFDVGRGSESDPVLEVSWTPARPLQLGLLGRDPVDGESNEVPLRRQARSVTPEVDHPAALVAGNAVVADRAIDQRGHSNPWSQTDPVCREWRRRLGVHAGQWHRDRDHRADD